MSDRMIYKTILQSLNKKKLFALHIDPDKYDKKSLITTILKADKSGVDFIFAGGSLLAANIDDAIDIIKNSCSIPVILFPGSLLHISIKADAILLLMLISGRNPDLLIGNHVIASNFLRKSKLEILSTGYMIVENGKTSSVEYMSGTKPIPSDKNDIAVATAVAGEMIGNKLIYIDAGSGAVNPVRSKMIEEIKKNISVPLIAGGGISSEKDISDICKAGADIIVIGNAIEKNISFIQKASELIHSL
jgi:phosphoglycerol geranylgeranyltransferase